MDPELLDAAIEVANLLKASGHRLVLAESCTGGLVAASLVGIAGISEWLTGSAVVYRDDTKHRWLDVSEKDLANPAITAVSEVVARQMAEGVLRKTPEADWSVATTGHLGPGAPASIDGLVFIAAARREEDRIVSRAEPVVLASPTPVGSTDHARRGARQREAAIIALRMIRGTFLEPPFPGESSRGVVSPDR